MLQGIAGVVLVLIGGYLALVADTSAEMRFFGWVLAVLGLLGLAAAVLLARRRQDG